MKKDELSRAAKEAIALQKAKEWIVARKARIRCISHREVARECDIDRCVAQRARGILIGLGILTTDDRRSKKRYTPYRGGYMLNTHTGDIFPTNKVVEVVVNKCDDSPPPQTASADQPEPPVTTDHSAPAEESVPSGFTAIGSTRQNDESRFALMVSLAGNGSIDLEMWLTEREVFERLTYFKCQLIANAMGWMATANRGDLFKANDGVVISCQSGKRQVSPGNLRYQFAVAEWTKRK